MRRSFWHESEANREEREESKVLRWKKLVFSAQKLEDEMERRKKGLKGIFKLFLHFILLSKVVSLKGNLFWVQEGN